eukprot:CAMPEP_0201662192 /NCGR_PEP_ID=MMETSP0494-20130426/4356_1 /ASSEMBLY_ACC=CAM_ASM_000839 /TAXON_ID=420259 /ORGANISM="Thalassiosira gravida, Strain GMp14c1" /LENGTH=724 /DNA_ID=CAMNT_0048140501 /DNA_START=275 /DNA_END=2449 /DNA_ORIENTATION=-
MMSNSTHTLMGLGQKQQQTNQVQQPPIMLRRESAPAPTSSLYHLSGNNFNAGLFGRVPNFSSQYLTSLDNASSGSLDQQAQQQHQQQQPQQPQPIMQPLTLPSPQQQSQMTMTMINNMNGGQASPTASDQSGRSLGVDAFMSNATIVSNAVSTSYTIPAMMSATNGVGTAMMSGVPGAVTPPQVVITTAKKPANKGGDTHKRGRRQHHKSTIPTSIHLSPSQQRQGGIHLNGLAATSDCPLPPAHPVPEFLCHLYSMLNDPALSDLIGWVVPTRDESTDSGGGKANIGKIVVRDPTRLQNEVLGKYYRHSKYSSFQRQLNYFGFKKRLHGSKKGKMCPCSFVHDTLGSNPASLLNLKRRPPSGKRVGSEPNLLVGGGSSKSSTNSLKPKKGVRRGSLPTNVSIGSSVATHTIVASMKNVNSNKNNAMWGTTTAPAPLNMMPTIAQVAASFPGNSWPMPSNIVVGNNGSAPADSNPSGAGNSDMGDEILRANNAVLEAKKSLARNFLKSQREAQRGGQQAQQQVPIPAPNRSTKPNPFSALTMVGQVQLMQQPQTITSGIGNNWMGQLQQQQQEPLVKPSCPFPAKTIAFPTNCNATNIPAQANTFLGTFPSNLPIIVNNNHIASLSSSAANTTSTNFLMAPNSSSNDAMVFSNNGIGNGAYDSQSQGMAATPEIPFNDMLSNLLSTALPPSEELFDDDLSVGNISDFGLATALQFADDGMLLPE